MNPPADASPPVFTPKQGQYLAFIHAYTLVNERPPVEADMMRFFRATPPAVHQMVLKLEQLGLISRKPGAPRSIVVVLDRTALPRLGQPSLPVFQFGQQNQIVVPPQLSNSLLDSCLVHLAGFGDSFPPDRKSRALFARHISKGFKPPARCTSPAMPRQRHVYTSGRRAKIPSSLGTPRAGHQA